MSEATIPNGMTCGQCRNFSSCAHLIRTIDRYNRECDWSPHKFRISDKARIADLEAERDRLRAACAGMRVALKPFSEMEISSDGFGHGSSLELVWCAGVVGGSFDRDEADRINPLFKAARQALSSDGSGYAAVVSAAQPLRSVDPEIMFRGHAEDYVKAEMPVSIWHNFMQAIDALDKGDG